MGNQIQISEEIVLDRIEKALRLQETELDLSGWELKEVPREIGKLV